MTQDELIERLNSLYPEVQDVLSKLTKREQRLIREVAVMGYVLGRRHPEGSQHPKDSEVLYRVVSACLTMPDLYPVLSWLAEGEEA